MLFDLDDVGADYEELVVVQDPPSGLRAVIALHSTRRGPAFGGIRRAAYPDEASAVRDAVRLAGMMSYKCAVAELPAGGGKAVVLDHAGLQGHAAYRALGRAVARLGGRYVCGPDVGTGEAELGAVRSETDRVNPKGNDAGAATARGVLAGLRGLLRVLDGDPSVADKRFVVQGLGSVGMAVVGRLVAGGAQVLATDVRDVARKEARALGASTTAPEEALSTPCDVFVPCALGDVLSRETADVVRARGVCGSANNQLADGHAGRILHERGVLYAPDFVVNGGAVIEGVFTVRDGATDAVRAQAAAHIDRIEETVRQVVGESVQRDVPPHVVAMKRAESLLR